MRPKRRDRIVLLRGIRAMEPDRPGRVVLPRMRIVDEMQCVHRPAIVDRVREVPADALLPPQAHQEHDIALAGLHREGALRIAFLETAGIQPEGTGEHAVALDVGSQYVVRDIDDRLRRKHAPRDALAQDGEAIFARQFAEHEAAVGRELVHAGHNGADGAAAAGEVGDLERDGYAGHRLERQPDVGGQALQPVMKRFADAFAAGQPVWQQRVGGQPGVGRELRLEQPLRLRELRQQLVELLERIRKPRQRVGGWRQ